MAGIVSFIRFVDYLGHGIVGSTLFLAIERGDDFWIIPGSINLELA